MDTFNELEKELIRKEMSRKSAKDLAFLLDRSIEEVRLVISGMAGDARVIPLQHVIDQNRKPRAGRQKKKKEKVIISRIIESDQKAKRARGNQPQFKTKSIDYSQLVLIRIDHKTQIYIRPDQDPETERQAYLDKLQQHNSRMLANNLKN